MRYYPNNAPATQLCRNSNGKGCGKRKPISEFRIGHTGAYLTTCKKCEAETSKRNKEKRMKEDPDREIAIIKNYYKLRNETKKLEKFLIEEAERERYSKFIEFDGILWECWNWPKTVYCEFCKKRHPIEDMKLRIKGDGWTYVGKICNFGSILKQKQNRVNDPKYLAKARDYKEKHREELLKKKLEETEVLSDTYIRGLLRIRDPDLKGKHIPYDIIQLEREKLMIARAIKEMRNA
jgi:hypothetical protein